MGGGQTNNTPKSEKKPSIVGIVVGVLLLISAISSFSKAATKYKKFTEATKDTGGIVGELEVINNLETVEDYNNYMEHLNDIETGDYNGANNNTLTIESNDYKETQTVDNPIDVKSSDFTIDKDYSFYDDDGWHTVIVITVNTENKAIKLSATAYDSNNIIVDEMADIVNVPKGNQGIIEIYPGYYSDLEGRTDLRYEYAWETYEPPFPSQGFGYEIEESHKKGNAVEITVRQTEDNFDFYAHSPELLAFKDGVCVGTGEFIIGDKLKGKGTACYVEANGWYRLKDFDTWKIYKD